MANRKKFYQKLIGCEESVSTNSESENAAEHRTHLHKLLNIKSSYSELKKQQSQELHKQQQLNGLFQKRKQRLLTINKQNKFLYQNITKAKSVYKELYKDKIKKRFAKRKFKPTQQKFNKILHKFGRGLRSVSLNNNYDQSSLVNQSKKSQQLKSEREQISIRFRDKIQCFPLIDKIIQAQHQSQSFQTSFNQNRRYWQRKSVLRNLR